MERRDAGCPGTLNRKHEEPSTRRRGFSSVAFNHLGYPSLSHSAGSRIIVRYDTRIMDSSGLDRRDFLLTAALALTATTGNTQGAAPPSWWDKPMRWAQLTLVEDDPGKYDLSFWLDYFKRTHSDAACLSAGGCVAYYPTKVPLHYRSQWLGNSDPFGDLVAGCRKMNMVVIARTDPHAARQEVYDAHPDWIAVEADGKKRPHWAIPGWWLTCALGPYNFEFMTEVTREIV